MKEAFDHYLESYLQICPNLSEEELHFIRENLTITKLKKGEYYLEKGHLQANIGFIHSGLLKSYYVDDRGEKITISFIKENTHAADYPSFILQKPAKYFIQVIEHSVIVNLPYTAIQNAYKNYKNFENYGRLVAEHLLLRKQDLIESFLFNNAEERYIHFLKENQDIINRISVSDLSSLLGIKRQSLTRIRKKLITKRL